VFASEDEDAANDENYKNESFVRKEMIFKHGICVPMPPKNECVTSKWNNLLQPKILTDY